MFKIDNSDKTIMINRGDSGTIIVGAKDINKSVYTFKKGDIVRFNVAQKKKEDNVVISIDTPVTQDTTKVYISLTSKDTKIGKVINKPVTYWYDIELNPDSEASQTIIGYDEENGASRFILYPESYKI